MLLCYMLYAAVVAGPGGLASAALGLALPLNGEDSLDELELAMIVRFESVLRPGT